MASEDGPTLLTPREASQRLSVSVKTLTRWADEGLVSVTRLPGGHRRYRRAEIEAIERGEVSA